MAELIGCVIEKRDGGVRWAVITPHSCKGHRLVFDREETASAVCDLIREAYCMGQEDLARRYRDLLRIKP